MAIIATARFDELGTQKKKIKKSEKADHHELISPNDIIDYEILPRLPAKSVCRFKSVSKQWKRSLSSHIFGKMHQFHHINNNIQKTYKLLLLDKPRVDCGEPLNDGSSGTVGFNLLEEADPRFDMVLASLDGLVCVASSKIVNSLALWNPLTRACYKLPPHPKKHFFPYHPRLDVIGFYSDSSNDYKLLYLVSETATSNEAYIYSQTLNSWRKIEFVIGNYGEPYFYYNWSQATLCDQSLYFSVRRFHLESLKNDHDCIICFDGNTEDSRIIQFPPLPSGATCPHSSLVVIDGCIHLCVAYYTTDYVMFKRGNMWKLINGDSWVEVAFFPGAPVPFSLDILSHDPPNVCITRNAQDSWLAILEGNNNSFKIMNMEEFTLTEHSLSSYSACSLITHSRIIYEETLLSPNPPHP
uniref:putative F-box protein At2g02030 n=1 Tax=Erigeron canadensis TaxID=72917 RepID=UPI001CB95A2C|nr:putative F-box protein At2g02030 [Erigeron canadensis]